ncbi:zinc finger MYM-type protein 3-like [Oncorhynchus keta]|uniref:zinc finger MYM-type protein 3-like n=1 Tax=Oncorhynchus keta TaxID=8018 RepID=UPI00227A657C|nr:zinc finger MYM-type protein 3-like [Oncorhynchus keta]XP_035602845.2 zinc finger MYM-type protein 3-like [Oncorhynchus keta]XP_035602846.2 zinc finger MYM-type protein 3-like [Oncorhynchus keta]XP_052346154.1 zinc finger MYM-type protein 3-like [Oncorhynchus keta]
MPGSLCIQCQTQTTVFSKTCNSCFFNHPKEKMLQALNKYDYEWEHNDCTHYNNSSQILTSTKVLLYKLHTLGFVPLLLLGKRRNGTKHIDMDSFCPHPQVIKETGSIETLRNIYLGLLNVTLGTESQCQCSPVSSEPDGTPAPAEVEGAPTTIDPVGTPAPTELHRIPISIRLNIIPTPTETCKHNTLINPVETPTTINPAGTPTPTKRDGIPISLRRNLIPTPTEPGKPSTPTNPVGIPTPTSLVGTPTAIDPSGTPAPTMLDRIPTSISLNKITKLTEPGKHSTSTNPVGTPSPINSVGTPAPAELDGLPTPTEPGKPSTSNKLDGIPTYICLNGIPTSICMNGTPTSIQSKIPRLIQPKIPRPIQPKFPTPIQPGKPSTQNNPVGTPIPIDETSNSSEHQDQEMQRPKRKMWTDGDLIVAEDGATIQAQKKIKTTEEWLNMDTDRPTVSRHAEVDTEILDQLEKHKEESLNMDTDRPMVSRHAEVDTEVLDQLEKSSIVQATNKQTLWAINCFKDWLTEKQMIVDFSTIEKSEMNVLLRDFYCSVRRGKGGEYCIPSYIGIRAGVNRFINLPPLSRSWCLMKDSEFTSSNNVFLGVLKKLRREGRDKTTHPKVITAQDLEILQNSTVLSPYTPRGLVNKVWFDIQLHFGPRGKEGNRRLTPQSFVIRYDENGAKYATLTSKEERPNHKDAEEQNWQNRCGIMFQNPDSPLCPVASLEKYLSKIPPDATALYLHPKKMVITSDSMWYSQEPMGFNYLSSMLPRLCQEAGTLEKYTNNCFRTLREVMSVSRLIVP